MGRSVFGLKIVTFFVFTGIFAGIVGFSNSDVSPISVDSDQAEIAVEPGFEVDLQDVLVNPKPAAVLRSLFERQVKIHYRAAQYLAEFDQDLKNASEDSWELQSSPAYRKLMAIRVISDRTREKTTYLYRRLLELRQQSEFSGHRKATIDSLIEEVSDSLPGKDQVEALALEDLRHDLNGIAMRHGRRIPSFFKDSADLSRAAADVRNKELSLAAKINKNDPDHLNLMREEKEVQKLIWTKEILGGRAPQNVKYEPSVGSNGNINGSTFPANTWALTYDDGPSTAYTPKALENLQRLGKKATFFWLAQNVKLHPELVKQVQAAGMNVENHSYTHANLIKLGEIGLKKEIITATEVDTQIYGEKPKFFRCPYGSGVSVSRIRKMIADEGMIHVMWNVDSLDWQDKNPESVLARVKSQMAIQKHGIVLFHDIHPQSIEASRMLLEWSNSLPVAEQHNWVTIPGIVSQLNGESQ